MKIQNEEYKYALAHFLGYGNPVKAKIFFFGLEEKGDADEDEDEKKKYYVKMSKEKETFFITMEEMQENFYNKYPNIRDSDYRKAQIPTYQAFRYIYNSLVPSNPIDNNFDLGKEKCDLFISNLSPINKKRTQEKNPTDSENILNNYEQLLILFFKKFIIGHDKLVITFGKHDKWKTFLTNELNITFPDTSVILSEESKNKVSLWKSNLEKIYITYHPARGWLTSRCQDKLIKEIKKIF